MTKRDKIIQTMLAYEISCPEAGYGDKDALYWSISEYEAVTGQKFPYTQEEYERHCN